MLFQTVLFCIAAAFAAIISIRFIFPRGLEATSVDRLSVFIIAGAPIAVLAVLSALYARDSLELAWLFSTEETDAGPIEYGTVLFFLMACGLSFLIARADQTMMRFAYIGLGAACFLIAGEELSWGQWIFHWETPEALAEVNLQQETNIHNLVNPRLYDPIYAVAGFALIAMCAASVLCGARRWLSARADMPVIGEIAAFTDWLGTARFGMVLTLSTAVLLQHESFEEYSEVMLSLTLALFLMHRLRMVSAPAGQFAPAE